MPDVALFVLIFISLGVGFAIGRRERERHHRRRASTELDGEYFVGLNYLLNEQTDEAIESFIRALEVGSDSVDTFMITGRLFRQRGELDRAIQTHQDLLARPSLNREQMLDVQLELARDYMKAGLFDRAETLLKDIVAINWRGWRDSLNHLLSIYEKEKEWKKAITLLAPLKGSLAQEFADRRCHYLCEQAETALHRSDLLRARKYLRQALLTNAGNVRVSLLLGQLELLANNPREAIRVLEKIIDQNRTFIPESIGLLEQAYEQLNSQRGLSRYLERCLQETPSAAVIMASARLLASEQGEKEAANFVAEQIIRRPSLKGLNALIDIHLQMAEGQAHHNLAMLRELTGRLEDSKPVYRCCQCGFDGKELYWQCPRCHEWGSINPIMGLEGE